MTGGNGYDGQTVLSALDSIEMGGSLIIEAGNVVINPASQGILCGLYSGPVLTANCFAGYSVRQSSGSTVLTPTINGIETGTTFAVQNRPPLHASHPPAQPRSPARPCRPTTPRVDGVVESFGGGSVASQMTLVFDLVDQGASSNTPATILYGGAALAPVLNTPAACTFAVVNAAQIFGSIGYISVTPDRLCLHRQHTARRRKTDPPRRASPAQARTSNYLQPEKLHSSRAESLSPENM